MYEIYKLSYFEQSWRFIRILLYICVYLVNYGGLRRSLLELFPTHLPVDIYIYIYIYI